MSNDLSLTQEKAKKVLETIRGEIAAIEAELKEVKRTLDQVQSERSALVADVEELRRQENYWAREAGEEPQSAIPEIPSPRRTHREIIESILRRNNKGMTTPEIAREMIADGHNLPEKRNYRHATVYTAMYRRQDVFRTFARGVWGLQEWGNVLPGEAKES